MPRYKFTQESGIDFKVVQPDKADAQEDTNEVRRVVDDLGNLLVHSKRDDSYPKDGTTGGNLAIPESQLNISNIVFCSDYDHPDDAITAIASANKTLLITEAETCDTNFTVPANVTVRFEKGGKWTINNGITVTFNGQIDAGLWQIFEYVGTGVITNLTQEVFTAWWGGDVGIQINAAVAALLNSKGIITIPVGTYSFNTPIVLSDDITLQGAGQLATTLNWTGTNNTQDIITTNGNQLVLRDFGILVGSGKFARSIVYIQNTRSSHFINLYLRGDSGDNTTTLNGMYADGNIENNVYYNLFENVFIYYCNENWRLVGTSVTQNTLINCKSSSAGLYGYYGSGNKIIIIGMCFEQNPTALKIFYGGMDITGCYFEGNTDTDIYIDHPKGVVIRGSRFRSSSTKDYIIYCTGISGEYDGIQIRDNIIFHTANTVTTAICLYNGAEAFGNVFVVSGGAITNEYYAPAGSIVNGFGGTGYMSDIANRITFTGNYSLGLTLTANTVVTLPTSGTIYGTKAGSITSAQLLASLNDKTGEGLAVFNSLPKISNPSLSGLPITLNDDTAISFTPRVDTGILFLYCRSLSGVDATPNPSAILIYDVTGTIGIASMFKTADITLATGLLGGTTGVDGDFTISVHTDGKIYIENRSGGTRYFAYYGA